MGTDVYDGCGSIDWNAVKSTGITWSYCKVNGGYSNTGYEYQDQKFSAYWPQLKQANMARGAFCFFDLNADGTTQAKLFMQLLDAAGGMNADDLPPCLDIEWTPSPKSTPFPTSKQWQNEALEWLAYVEKKTGRLPIIYTDASMARNNFDSRFSKYPLWVADYPSERPIKPTSNPFPSNVPKGLGPWKDWTIWQYSAWGTISGIGQNQDLDILAGSVEELVKATTVK